MRSRTFCLSLLILMGGALAHADEVTKSIDIPAQPLASALRQFAEQTGLQLAFETALTAGQTSPAVKGEFSSRDALQKLLSGTGLRFEFLDARTVAVSSYVKTSALEQAANAGAHLAQVDESPPSAEEGQSESSRASVEKPDETSQKGIPEILVRGLKSLNTDIRRTESAIQPYVIFDRTDIESAHASSVDEFLKTRLPMNTVVQSNNQDISANLGNQSKIDLRGLGGDETLILVNGRRMPRISLGGEFSQADINGIPIALIERIEILPATAGGIYGGGATGGVVNVILRRDYTGIETTLTYGQTSRGDAARRQINIRGGFSLEGGRTNVMIAASRSDQDDLRVKDRDFALRSRALQLANNPAQFQGIGPPSGYTTNIQGVDPDTFELVNLTLDNGTPLNSPFTSVPVGYSGPDSDDGAGLAANAGRYNYGIPFEVQNQAIYGSPVVKSLALNVRREFGAHVEAFLDVSSLENNGRQASVGGFSPDGSYTFQPYLPAGAPNNPFQQGIFLTFAGGDLGISTPLLSDSKSLTGAGGIIVRLPRTWMIEADFNWSRSRFETFSSVPLIVGFPEEGYILRDTNAMPIDVASYLDHGRDTMGGPYDNTLRDTTLRFSGPVLQMPAGPLMASGYLARREEDIRSAFSEDPYNDAIFYSPPRSQSVNSIYLEGRIPIVGPGNVLPFLRIMELQASVRRDGYETSSVAGYSVIVPAREGPLPSFVYTTGKLASTDYTLGLRFAPSEDFMFRASFGTGFLPPSVSQIAYTDRVYPFPFGLDPKRSPGGVIGVPDYITLRDGGNPDLLPESSRSFSAGVIVTPRFLRELRLSVDYVRIRKVDEIQSADPRFILQNEDAFPGRVVRGPNLDTDLPGWSGPVTLLDASLVNIARTTLEAYDFQLDYTQETRHVGAFHAYAIATWQPHYENQALPDSPVIDFAGSRLLNWRGNFGLSWNRGPWRLGWNAQYYDSYCVTVNCAFNVDQGSAKIDSQIYHDITGGYRFDNSAGAGFLADVDISFGIQNLLDKSPPALASTGAFSGGYSGYGDPRLRRYSISLRKSFGVNEH